MSSPSLDWMELSVQIVFTFGHFLWQACVVAVVLQVVFWAVKPRKKKHAATDELPPESIPAGNAHRDYNLACLAFFVLPLCVAGTFVFVNQSRPPLLLVDNGFVHSEATRLPGRTPDQPVESSVNKVSSDPVPAVFSPLRAAERPSQIAESDLIRSSESDWISATWIDRLQSHAPVFVVVYVVGVLILLGRFGLAVVGSARLQRTIRPLNESAILRTVAQQSSRIGLRIPPVVAACHRVSVPVVVGILKPVILLPSSVLCGLNAEQLASILAHEIGHIRRHDLLVNLLQRIVEALLFFHPVTWWISRRIRIERENCCDDLAAESTGRLSYASALLFMAEICLKGHPERLSGLAALSVGGHSSNQFGQRVRRLLGADRSIEVGISLRSVGTAGLAVALILFTSMLVWGQNQNFESSDSTGDSDAKRKADETGHFVGQFDADASQFSPLDASTLKPLKDAVVLSSRDGATWQTFQLITRGETTYLGEPRQLREAERVLVVATGYRRAELARGDGQPSDSPEVQIVRLNAANPVEFQLTDSKGRPAVGAAFRTMKSQELRRAVWGGSVAGTLNRLVKLNVISDRNGIVRFPRPAFSDWTTYRISHSFGTVDIPGRSLPEVTTGAKTRRTIRLRPYSQIVGTYPAGLADNEVLEICRLEANRMTVASRERFDLDPDGGFRIPRRIAGWHCLVHRIEFTDSENRRSSTAIGLYGPFRLSDGQTLNLIPGKAGQKVSGRLVPEADTDVDYHSFRLSVSSGQRSSYPTPPDGLDSRAKRNWWDEYWNSDDGRAYYNARQRNFTTPVLSDGSFSFPSLPPGKYRLSLGHWAGGTSRFVLKNSTFEVPATGSESVTLKDVGISKIASRPAAAASLELPASAASLRPKEPADENDSKRADPNEETVAAATGPGWGEESHGLRCRIVPVSPNADPDDVDINRPQRQFAFPEEMTFAVQIQNVSDHVIPLRDVRYAWGSGSGQAAPNHFGPHFFDFTFFDKEGSQVPRTQRDFVTASHAHILWSSEVKEIGPKQSLVCLIQPAMFERPMQYRLEAGEYRVSVRYRGPDKEARQWIEQRLSPGVPDTSWSHSVISNLASFSISGDESPVPNLAWGSEVKGLRAALEVRVPKGSGIATEAPGVLPETPLNAVLHLRNTSTEVIQFVSETHRQGDTLQITTDSGTAINVKNVFYTGWPIDVKWAIRPGQAAQLPVLSPSMNQNLSPGKYRARYTIRFGSRTMKDKDGNQTFPAPGHYDSEIDTGWSPLFLREPRQVATAVTQLNAQSDRSVPEGLDFGDPVAGIRIRLHPLAQLKLNAKPVVLSFDTKHEGELDLVLSEVNTSQNRIELNGELFQYSGPPVREARRGGFRSLKDTIAWQNTPGPRIVMGSDWKSLKNGKPLKLRSGQHTLRFGWGGFHPLSSDAQQPDRNRPAMVWSNTSEFVVLDYSEIEMAFSSGRALFDLDLERGIGPIAQETSPDLRAPFELMISHSASGLILNGQFRQLLKVDNREWLTATEEMIRKRLAEHNDTTAKIQELADESSRGPSTWMVKTNDNKLAIFQTEFATDIKSEFSGIGKGFAVKYRLLAARVTNGQIDKAAKDDPPVAVLRELFRLPERRRVGGLQFAPSGNSLKSLAWETAANQKGLQVTLRSWDVIQQKLETEVALEWRPTWKRFVSNLLMSSDCQRIVGVLNGEIAVWDAVSGQIVQRHHIPDDILEDKRYSVSLSNLVGTPNLSRIAFGRSVSIGGIAPDAYAIAMDVEDGDVICKVKMEHRISVQSLALSSDGKKLATVGSQHGASIWDVDSGKLLLDFRNEHANRKHPNPDIRTSSTQLVSGISFSPDGKLFAISDMLGIKLIEADTGKVMRTIDAPYRYHSGSPQFVFSPDGQFFSLLGTYPENGVERTISLWSTKSGVRLNTLAIDGAVAAFSNDEKWFAAGDSNRKAAIAVWQLSR